MLGSPCQEPLTAIAVNNGDLLASNLVPSAWMAAHRGLPGHLWDGLSIVPHLHPVSDGMRKAREQGL